MLPQSKLYLVHQALIYRHLRYGNLIWNQLLEKTGSLQKRHNREFYLTESAPIKDKTPSKRLSVEKITIHDRAIMVHKPLQRRCPDNLKKKFTRRTQISKYETRRIHDLQIPKPRLELSKKSFWYIGANVWNVIPNAIRDVESIHRFKHKMRTHLLVQ